MSKTITIEKGVMTSVNDESGILAGTRITIQNPTVYDAILKESATEPPATYVDFCPLLSRKYGPLSIKEVATGSLEIWAYCDASDITLCIEEL